MRSFYPLLCTLLLIMSACNETPKNYENVDWQGHRGARGVYPENTWAAFQYAIDQNMTTLEMDVVITQDEKVVVSHEPFLNHQICKDTAGNAIAESEEKDWNIYQMTYDELQKCDCGSIQNPNFPDQKTVSGPKPLLIDIINKVKIYCDEQGKSLPLMNVEIKYEEDMKGIYHPDIETFNSLVYNVLSNEYPQDKWNIQSFDFNVLKQFRKDYPKVPLAALVYESGDWKNQFSRLGFPPEIYSPYYILVTHEMVEELHEKGVKVIPWTVNDEKEIERLLKIGVDGIITDYPQLADKFRNNP